MNQSHPLKEHSEKHRIRVLYRRTFRRVRQSGRYEVMGGQSRDKEEEDTNLREIKDTVRNRAGRKTCRQKPHPATVGSFTSN